jgi:capsid protein
MVAFRRIFGFSKRVELAGERARRLHAQWLTRATMTGGVRAPRIPVRKVSEGGYEFVRKSPDGRAWADSWWSNAFRSTD